MSSGTGICAIIFDMDGVLTDSEPLINAAAVAMFRERGLTVKPEDFHPFIGTGENHYIGGVAEQYGFAIDVPSAKRRTYELYLERVARELHAFPGAVELVRSCKVAGLRVALASSADRVKIDANLRQIGLPSESWDAIVTGDDVEHKKPAPDLFLLAASKLGLASGQCVVVEDAVSGIQAAKASGMRCVAVAQSLSEEQLRGADLIKPRISDLTLELLLGFGGSPLAAGAASRPPVPRPWGLWATFGFSLVVFLAWLITQIVGIAGLAFLATRFGQTRLAGELVQGTSGLAWSLGAIVSAPVELGLILLFINLRRVPLLNYLAIRRVSRVRLLGWTALLLGFCVLSDALTWHLGRAIVPEVMIDAYRTAGWAPLLWLTVIIAAPLTEEVFFRGFIFAGIVHSPLGGIGAVVVTSLVWAAVHQQYDAYGQGMVFGAGLLLGYARLQTGSIFPCLAMHGLMNLLATVQVMTVVRFG